MAFATYFSLATLAHAQGDFNQKPIEYQTAPVSDPVYKLQQAIEAGEVQLTWDKRQGWLPSVLKELRVLESSQTLVFSKTSLQRSKISPHRPRAVYFNDDVYVGFCQRGDVLELSAVDPQLGAVFYTIDQKDATQPNIARDTGHCMSCHATPRTRGVPGFLVRSVFPDKSGEPYFRLGTQTTDHTTPFEQRFGGWYVTGQHGTARHRGNVIADAEAELPIDGEAGANLAKLTGIVNTAPYLQPGSDLVALMVLEHQSQVHNRITRANYQTREAMYYDEALNRALKRPAGTIGDSSQRRIEAAGEELLEYLLFADEAPLESPIEGSSSFTKDFAELGPRDSEGRSLRDFDLQTKLFRYPCSFLIYTDSMDALPDPMQEYLRRRLTEILTGQDESEAYAHLSAADRQAILEILSETKPQRLAE